MASAQTPQSPVQTPEVQGNDQAQPAPAGSTPGAAGQPVQPFASASLYVGELHPDITEAVLFDIFKQVGPVASIRVCRDAITRRSLGYAYVNFHSAQDAERALDTLNYTPIANVPCRIMWSHRDPAKRKSGLGNVFIKNLDKEIDHQNLYDTFSDFGSILSCKVEMDDSGASKGYGYVHYETAEEADLAISRVNGMILANRVVHVSKFKPKKEREQEIQNNFTNVFVKNLPEDVTEAELVGLFSKFGETKSCVIMKEGDVSKPAEPGSSRGFGFVNFANTADAKTAVDEMNNFEYKDNVLYVGRAQKKAERQQQLKALWEQRKFENLQKYQGVNLYVKNLDDTVTKEVLRKEFAHCGNITSTAVMKDDKNNSRGFGFVCFSTPEEATKAVTEMNGTMLCGKPIYVALAQRKEVRKAQLEAQHNARGHQSGMRMQPGMAHVYQGGPVFYGQGAIPNQRVMYQPNAMVAPRRWPQAQPGGRAGAQTAPFAQQPMNYMPAGAQRGARGGAQRGGRGQPKGGVNPAGRQGAPAVNSGRAAGFNNKFNNAPVRNSLGPQPGGSQQMGIGPQPGALGDQLPSTADLATASPEDAKQLLGEKLFLAIAQTHKDEILAGKITGMILEYMDNSELLNLLEDSEALDSKVSEAVDVLKNAQAKEEQPPAEAEN